MTDATTSHKTNVCDEYSNVSNDTVENQKNNLTQNCLCNTLQVASLEKNMTETGTDKLNTNGTSHSSNENIEPQKCNNTDVKTDTCKDEIKIDQNKNNDVMLKYVYKMTNKQDSAKKTKGHSKNSIERRKRSLEEETQLDDKSVLPSTIDYSTSHDAIETQEINLPNDKSEKIIQDRNLANFNIETLHENSNSPRKQENENSYKPLSDIRDAKSSKVIKDAYTSTESQERDNHEENGKNTSVSIEGQPEESNESNESNYSKSRKPLYNKQTENNKRLIPPKDIESDEIENNSDLNSENEEIKESYKHDDENSSEEDKSIENSSEGNKHENLNINNFNNDYKTAPADSSTAKPFQDVDLDNFSHERIHVNDKGHVESIKDSHENDYSDVGIRSTTMRAEITSVKNNKQYVPLTTDVDTPLEDDLNEPVIPPVSINDGEVKPVVELNNEDDSIESSEEISKEQKHDILENSEQNDSSSLEEINNKGINSKIVAQKTSDGEKVDVKQQFERIPLDYNHNNKTLEETTNKGKIENATVNQDENINDGTLDALIPRVHKYDDNLNIKFDDIGIKLPEINLPDDILSYAQIETPKIKKNKKKLSYHLDDEDDESEENLSAPKKSDTDVDKNQDYFGGYNNDKDRDYESYKKPYNYHDEDDDGGEDLYEKFVRERFGKKGSFGKRSEKLQERKVTNPKLLQTIQNILKKTERVHNEAEKSGDPNAGYMWTLEYGENL